MWSFFVRAAVDLRPRSGDPMGLEAHDRTTSSQVYCTKEEAEASPIPAG
jgi:hypothetical protein